MFRKLIYPRKLNVSVIFISQNYYRIPKIISNNCRYGGEAREVNIILKEVGLGVTKEVIDIYEYKRGIQFSAYRAIWKQESPN